MDILHVTLILFVAFSIALIITSVASEKTLSWHTVIYAFLGGASLAVVFLCAIWTFAYGSFLANYLIGG